MYADQLKASKDFLGENWLLHPSNKVKRKKVKLTSFQKLVKKVNKIKHKPVSEMLRVQK